MRTFIAILILFSVSSCDFLRRSPSGERSIVGSFTYFDYYVLNDPRCVSNCANGEMVVYRLKTERSFLVEIPVKTLIKTFFDKKKSIPFQGDFKGEVIYDSLNRVDSLKIESFNDQGMFIEVKAKDVN